MATAKIENVGNVGPLIIPTGLLSGLPTFLPCLSNVGNFRMLAGNIGNCQDSTD